MSQLRYTKGQLYIRRVHPKDGADSIFTAYAMAANGMLSTRRGKGHYYVAVRRGFPHEVLETALSKRDLKARFIGRPWSETRQWFRVKKDGSSSTAPATV